MAYRKIGSLLIGYDAETSRFTRGTDQVRQRLGLVRRAMMRVRTAARNLTRSFGNLLRRMASLRGVATVIAGAAGFGLLINKAAEFGADLKELSMQVGLSVEQLQGWQRVFEANGLAIDKTRKVLAQFAYAVGEAHQGSETYARLFRKLGVDLTDARGELLPMHELLLRVADGFAAMGNATEKAGLGTLLFGARNSKVIVTLDDGRKAITSSIDHFLKMGKITDQQATKLKALLQSVADFKNTVVSQIYGAIGDRADVFQKLLDSIAQLVRDVGPKFIDLLADIVSNWDRIASATESAIDAMRRYFNPPEPSHPLANIYEGQGLWRDKQERGIGVPMPAPRITIGGQPRQITEDTPRGSEMPWADQKGLKEFTKRLGDIRSLMDRFKDAAREAFGTFSESMRTAYTDATDYGQQFADVTLGAVDRMVDGIASGSFSAKDFLKSLLADIVKVILRATIMRSILQAVEGVQTGAGPLGKGLRDLFGMGQGPDAGHPVMSAGYSYRAHGGPVTAGRGYIVGERGPEFFSPGQDGRITPNDALAGVAGGMVTVNFQPVINRGDPAQIRAEIRDTLPVLVDLIESGILQKQARPSAHRQAIRNV